MILGIGIDIVSVKRFLHWSYNDKLASRFFIKEELEYIHSRGCAAPLSFASHFAAKEAYGKALGTGLSGMKLKDIAVLFSNNRPTLHLFGNAKLMLKKLGGSSVHISLSHEKDNSIALVIIEAS